MANEKIYIHELIEIIGANRAKSMHHMTAVWAPVRRDHQQTSLGVWAEVGSTGFEPRQRRAGRCGGTPAAAQPVGVR